MTPTQCCSQRQAKLFARTVEWLCATHAEHAALNAGAVLRPTSQSRGRLAEQGSQWITTHSRSNDSKSWLTHGAMRKRHARCSSCSTTFTCITAISGSLARQRRATLTADERDIYFASRIASAVATLFSDPDFRLSEAGFLRLIPLQRMLTNVFGASAFATADYIIALFNRAVTARSSP